MATEAGMVERVARVLYPEAFDVLPGHEHCEACLAPQHVARKQARVAIAAMREPTDAMREAAASELSGQMVEGWTFLGPCVWSAMIDEALKDG